MLKEMKTQTHLKPGQKGTKRLVEKYDDALLCVHYRYDEKRGVRLKTVELVVEEKSVKPAALYHDDDTVAAGARWNPDKQIWFVKYGKIAGTTLEKHIQVDENDKRVKQKKYLHVDDRQVSTYR